LAAAPAFDTGEGFAATTAFDLAGPFAATAGGLAGATALFAATAGPFFARAGAFAATTGVLAATTGVLGPGAAFPAVLFARAPAFPLAGARGTGGTADFIIRAGGGGGTRWRCPASIHPSTPSSERTR
jgi:hypothetical protein